MMVLNKRQNVNKINNRKMDPYEKAPTFDGPEHLSIYGNPFIIHSSSSEQSQLTKGDSDIDA